MNERRIHQIFKISVLLKGAHALIECIGGLVLTFVSTRAITKLVNALTQEELIRNPNDFVAAHLLSLAQNFTVSTQRFYAWGAQKPSATFVGENVAWENATVSWVLKSER